MLPRAKAFFTFIVERETIRLRKEAGELYPWTSNLILREYKFTNVRRENDRTSKEFAAFYKENITSTTRWDIILNNCGIARYFGRSEFLISLGWQKEFNADKIVRHAQRRRADGKRVFTGAYVITNQGISAPKEEVVTEYFLAGLADHASALIVGLNRHNDWKKFINQMMTLNGFGGSGFMAKEVTLDLIMATGWQPSDWNIWSPSGPGARRGAARVTGIDEPKSPSGMVYFRSAERTLEIMLDLYELRDELWPTTFTPLRLTDIQFQLCEFDKYERVRLGQGRPRSRYHARSPGQG